MVLLTNFQPNAMLEEPFVAKQDASRADASSEMRFVAANCRSGGAWIAIVGIGIAARVKEKEIACDCALRKSETMSTNSN